MYCRALGLGAVGGFCLSVYTFLALTRPALGGLARPESSEFILRMLAGGAVAWLSWLGVRMMMAGRER